MEAILKKLLVLRSPNVGPVTYNKLLSKYGDIDSVIESLNLNQDFIDSVKREIDVAHNMGIRYIADDDMMYPDNLLKVKNHPIVISVRGNTNVLSKKHIS